MMRSWLLFPVDLQYFNGEKTEKATPRKRKDARQKGQVARSADLSPALVLMAVFLLLVTAGSWMLETFLAIVREPLVSYTLMDVTGENLDVIAKEMALQTAKIVGPVMGAALVVALAGNLLQVGFLFTAEPLKMKWNKLNPVEGAKRIFSLRSLVELAKSILKISACLYVAYDLLRRASEEIVRLPALTVGEVLSFASGEAARLGLTIGVVLLVLAVLDYGYQRYEHEKSLRMSKQDIKEEFKRTEGDPLIKGRIKERQRQMAMRRMMQELPKADVVITNPTHFAVALRYDSASMTAPTVIAKGQDYMALKIRELAKRYGIVTMENKPLARALYNQVEVGQQIPEELFKAVAEVLAYVYKLQGRVK